MNKSNQRSSTSSDICELWNGVGIVRVVGTPSIVELIYRIPEKMHDSDTSGSAEIHTLATAKQSGLFVLRSNHIGTEKDLGSGKNSKTNTESSLSILESNSSHLAAPPNCAGRRGCVPGRASGVAVARRPSAAPRLRRRHRLPPGRLACLR